MTEHDIEINAMSDAHREIRRAMRALAIASTMLEDAEMPEAYGALRAAYDILWSVTQVLDRGIHEGDFQ